ncbi:telomere length and silencing protein 1 homolog [Aricia agestis]|uniref:telomere length and silencing protein 1 homolog n=1 Tax=Aricia agestis TaxID=91739 RepID=UPI001C206D3A|nr:telomere length and silencing protein 1 homolog [Aricia agestis]
MDEEQSSEVPKEETIEEIKFKPVKKKNLRQRIKTEDDDSEDEELIVARLQEAKEAQKLREKPNGISLIALATGQKVTLEEEITCKDPFNVKSGGMVNMQALKSGKVKQVDDAYDTGIGTQFSAETNKRDEDEEMMKYIEEQLAKRKEGDKDKSNQDDNDSLKYLAPEEAALLSLPEHLRISSAHRSEEMLSNQMLSGIPEVDLGIDAKIKNIEATEEAKMKLLWERQNKKDGPSQFVPTNMAVNFVQHNRFNIDNNAKKRKVEKVEVKPETSVIDESVDKIVKKAKGERATDDYHYEKFRKQFRRY